MGGDWESWSALLGTAAPSPRFFPYFTTADAVRATAGACRRLPMLAAEHRIVTVARGKHVVVPRGAGARWLPDPVEAAWLIAAARFAPHRPHISGLSAAALHGAAARPHDEVHVTVPFQARALELPALAMTVRFHQRDPEEVAKLQRERFGLTGGEQIAVTQMRGEICMPLVTTPAQTVLDLLHSPTRAGDRYDALDAADRLVRRVPLRELDRLAAGQRRLDASDRILGKRWPRRRP
ncbi:type IV toxin-antitoxin system AbiEi family antitoxin [Demequina mangrovi]|uniref:Transcriptional regulator, AbiEi antitoxin, Type IV TA system n=1 Tax=Demequina mangrovi TaxID=1043493 RepID=A0A1H7AVR2_9MICO|nr:type IV toxin-antitoxin system AbiEi family antitoxin [Demequina mangrovi]SEJ66192.1 Transcriptional regulator, AbiEi antitoxin, Type IV TA system [Demequina mangrovi]